VPSTPADQSVGVLNGIARVCERAGIDPTAIDHVMHGTTVATNTVLTGTGARCGLVTTQGYRQVLQIARSFVPGGLGGWVIYNKSLPMAPLLVRLASAHVMGGCGMAGRPDLGVVRPDGRHWQVENLSVHDGSLFPTSIGANPQLSIYGLVNRLATQLAVSLGGRPVQLA